MKGLGFAMRNIWDEIFESEQFYSDLNPRGFVKENVSGISPSSGPVLDLGCGIGRHLIYLAASGYRVYGIDYSKVALEKAEENLKRFNLNATLEEANMWEVPFDDIRFAAVLAMNVLNHAMITDIRRTVGNIYRRLLPKGVFLLTLLTNNDYRRCGEQKDTNTFICDKGPERGILHTFFGKKDAERLLSRLNIEKVEMTSADVVLENEEKVHQEFFSLKARKE